MQRSSNCFIDLLGVVYRSLRSAFDHMRWRLLGRYLPSKTKENLSGSIQCSEENDESLLPGSLATNNTSQAEHMDLFHVELAVLKKIEYLHFKTSNHGEMDFYSLELK